MVSSPWQWRWSAAPWLHGWPLYHLHASFSKKRGKQQVKFPHVEENNAILLKSFVKSFEITFKARVNDVLFYESWYPQ